MEKKHNKIDVEPKGLPRSFTKKIKERKKKKIPVKITIGKRQPRKTHQFQCIQNKIRRLFWLLCLVDPTFYFWDGVKNNTFVENSRKTIKNSEISVIILKRVKFPVILKDLHAKTSSKSKVVNITSIRGRRKHQDCFNQRFDWILLDWTWIFVPTVFLIEITRQQAVKVEPWVSECWTRSCSLNSVKWGQVRRLNRFRGI